MIGLMRAMAFTGGDWVIYVLLLCSVLTLAVIVERAVVLSKERKEFEKVKTIFEREISTANYAAITEHLKDLHVLPARVITDGISKIPQGVFIVEETITSSINSERKRLETRMMILNTLGNNAVYIGLFGTVLGVIKAFKDLSLAGGGGAEVVMQGLSEALIATATGLIVAIPCVMSYNFFQKKSNKKLLLQSKKPSNKPLERFVCMLNLIAKAIHITVQKKFLKNLECMQPN